MGTMEVEIGNVSGKIGIICRGILKACQDQIVERFVDAVLTIKDSLGPCGCLIDSKDNEIAFELDVEVESPNVYPFLLQVEQFARECNLQLVQVGGQK